MTAIDYYGIACAAAVLIFLVARAINLVRKSLD